jgi:predicted Rossmann fold nucleotide-binding protein DprA/Smf involved in DNA uptake
MGKTFERHEKVGVIGSRDVQDRQYVFSVLEDHASRAGCILAGGALGVDRLAEEYAVEKCIPFILFKPYFMLDPQATYSVRHYFTRNKQIIDNADTVVAIWDGESPGTSWGINYARKRGKKLFVYTDPKETIE